jgi:hypothetical protein
LSFEHCHAGFGFGFNPEVIPVATLTGGFFPIPFNAHPLAFDVNAPQPGYAAHRSQQVSTENGEGKNSMSGVVIATFWPRIVHLPSEEVLSAAVVVTSSATSATHFIIFVT